MDASGTLDEAVVVALGGNLAGDYGSPKAALEAALGLLADAGLKIVRRSSWWRSASWPDPSMPDYLNAVVLVETRLGPQEALEALHRIEAGFGRERAAANAPRVLDLDLIAHGRSVLDGEGGLVLPHPRAADRLFVMGPLAEVAPGWRHPVLKETAAALAARASVGRDATPQD
jgi:2-amino-4-hydroxy-6-hydroxymethyldihydropteridine diphosphokinase